MAWGDKSQVFLSFSAALWRDDLDWLVWKDREQELVRIWTVNGMPQYTTSHELDKGKGKQTVKQSNLDKESSYFTAP